MQLSVHDVERLLVPGQAKLIGFLSALVPGFLLCRLWRSALGSRNRILQQSCLRLLRRVTRVVRIGVSQVLESHSVKILRSHVGIWLNGRLGSLHYLSRLYIQCFTITQGEVLLVLRL